MPITGVEAFDKKLSGRVKRRIKQGGYDYSANARARASFSGFQRRVATGRGDAKFEVEPIAVAQERMLAWCFEKRRHLSIGAPPSIFKSYTARNFLCWRLGVDPLTRTVVCSQNLSISGGIVSACRGVIASRRYSRVFSEVELDTDRNRKAKEEAKKDASMSQGNRQEKFYFLNSSGDPDPAMEAVAFHTTALNRRVDVGVFDDIETDSTARTLEGREKTFTTLMNKWVNGRLIHPKGKGIAIVLSNCWHEDDLLHRLAKSSEFVSMWIYVREDLSEFEIRLFNCPKDNPIAESCADPEKAFGIQAVEGEENVYRCPFPLESDTYSYEGIREKQGATPNFESVFRFIALSDEDRMFANWPNRKLHRGTVATAHDTIMLDGFRIAMDKQRLCRFCFAWGYDIAAAARKHGQQRRGEVLTLWSRDVNGIFRPVFVRFANRLSIEEIISTVESFHAAGVRIVTFRIENNSTQDKIVDEIKIETRNRGLEWQGMIEPHTTGANKHTSNGLPGIDLLMKNGQFEWPIEMATMRGCADDWTRLETQFRSCPRFFSSGVDTPDGVMSSWFAIKGLQERASFGGSVSVEAVLRRKDSAFDDDAPRGKFSRF